MVYGWRRPARTASQGESTELRCSGPLDTPAQGTGLSGTVPSNMAHSISTLAVTNRLVEDYYKSRLIVADRGFDDVCGGDGVRLWVV